MTGIDGLTMSRDEHRLLSTPVSVNDGLKRADGRTWAVLGVAAIVAGLVVLAVNLFVPKPNVRWPDSRPAATTDGRAGVPKEEPRTYDVAPPAASPNR
jgi:hypothetical protein